ncbi:hypothetical protein PoB_005409800 [Plakobranchus ocellatus]|uniref:Uncharacterized protein n=1 Tax=Plakobranchus ocellatus TaxID=259542 RepID=A0AAV4C6V1_9GAST|nr:hypothetical protein PoB_005409800 [Plakobranchus ocellatus]
MMLSSDNAYDQHEDFFTRRATRFLQRFIPVSDFIGTFRDNNSFEDAEETKYKQWTFDFKQCHGISMAAFCAESSEDGDKLSDQK